MIQQIIMSAVQSQVKEIVTRELKEILHTKNGSEQNIDLSNVDVYPEANGKSGIVVPKNVSKSVKSFVEYSLLNDIDNYLKEIGNTNKETWKVDAHNLSKVFSDQSKLSCLQDNLGNILDSCLKEVNEPNIKYSVDTELDISPLLQPEHINEVVECMSYEKPLDVRLNALRVLLKSHFAEAVNGEGWFILQKKLVDSLCDSNIDVFATCLKVHAKLASSHSSTALKECCLNVLESLSRHYYLQHGECKVISFQNIHFYRMVYLTRLLLDIFREATLNVARFGESRLDEMIDSLIQLLSVHVPSKQSRNKYLLSPLEVLSYLDPHANWLLNLTHFTLTRRLFLSHLRKDIGFLRTAVEEVIHWSSEPTIPSKNTSKVLQGELNTAVHRYSFFCHSLSAFTIVCSFGSGCTLFPINTNKNEDLLLSIEHVLRMLIMLLNGARFNEILQKKGTDRFTTFIAQNISKLLCLKEISGSMYLFMLLEGCDNQDPLKNPIKIQIFNTISCYKSSNNPFLNTNTAIRRKVPTFSQCFVSNSIFFSNQSPGNIKQRRDIQCQPSVSLPIDTESSTEISPLEVYLKRIIRLRRSDFKEDPCLIQIMTRMCRDFDKMLEINYTLEAQTVKLIAEIYIQIQDNFKQPDFKCDNGDINLSECCAKFLLQIATSPLGFYMLDIYRVITPLLHDQLGHLVIDWTDPVWLLFIAKATTSSEGCGVLASESNRMLRKELIGLWNIIEEDCSGSVLPVEDAVEQLLIVVANISLSLEGVKALFYEPENLSDVTLTDENDIRPSNICSLIQQFALSDVNCPNFIHHEFGLTALDILISNIDVSLYLQHRLNYQDTLLQIQSDNRVDENSEVIIDECSLLRHKIIEKSYLPGRVRLDIKPSHLAPRPDSTFTQAKSRSRGTGELARWLSETRLGLHDHNWLKHARKLYRNLGSDEIKGSTIIDLLEQVVKVLPEIKTTINLLNVINEDVVLEPEEKLSVQLVMRYGSQHRIIQATQQNYENLSYLILVVKASLNHKSKHIGGFDWFVASVYLICSGNIDKSQSFLSLVSALPTASLLWFRLNEPSVLAQLGNVLEIIIAEEMPAIFQLLRSSGLSWWQLCCTWIRQCWWNMLDWPQICHWFILSILHQIDHLLYFCVAVLQVNHDQLLKAAQAGKIYEIITKQSEKFVLTDTGILIDKLYKKYHSILHCHLTNI